jgi:hypothetical protein
VETLGMAEGINKAIQICLHLLVNFLYLHFLLLNFLAKIKVYPERNESEPHLLHTKNITNFLGQLKSN